MASKIFEKLLIEKIDQFKSSFSSTSKEIFFDDESKRIFHNGEYGTYREAVVRDFLKFIIPGSLDVSTGFLITSMEDVSKQCDVIIFDSKMTPIYEEGDRQRFFPIESVYGIGEVKSTLSKSQFKEAINKLAKNKALGERIKTPCILSERHNRSFNPSQNPNDLISSFIICQKLDFNTDNLIDDINTWYDPSVNYRHRHNMILSIEDGILLYHDQKSKKALPFCFFAGDNLKNRFIIPDKNQYAHFKFFATYMFMLTTSKTLLYPEITDYMETILET